MARFIEKTLAKLKRVEVRLNSHKDGTARKSKSATDIILKSESPPKAIVDHNASSESV